MRGIFSGEIVACSHYAKCYLSGHAPTKPYTKKKRAGEAKSRISNSNKSQPVRVSRDCGVTVRHRGLFPLSFAAVTMQWRGSDPAAAVYIWLKSYQRKKQDKEARRNARWRTASGKGNALRREQVPARNDKNNKTGRKENTGKRVNNLPPTPSQGIGRTKQKISTANISFPCAICAKGTAHVERKNLRKWEKIKPNGYKHKTNVSV